MAKIDPYLLATRASDSISRLLTDESNPGVEIEITVRKLNTIEVGFALQRGEELYAKHVTGFGEPGTDGYVPPQWLPPVGGQAVIFGQGTGYVAAAIELAQTTGERYTAEELISFAVYDGYALGLSELVGEISPKAQKAKKPE